MTGAEIPSRLPLEISKESEVALQRITWLHKNRSSGSELIVLELATVVETCVNDTIDILVEKECRRFSGSSMGFASYLLMEQLSGFTSDWHSRKKTLRKGLGVFVEPQSVQQKFDDLVEIRNALAHGANNFTPRQTSKDSFFSLRKRVAKSLDIQSHGSQFTFGDRTGYRATLVAREYIIALDGAVQRRSIS